MHGKPTTKILLRVDITKKTVANDWIENYARYFAIVAHRACWIFIRNILIISYETLTIDGCCCN